MALFAISDLHLSGASDKPMDVFGGQWHDHPRLIEKNWKKNISENDTVVVAGDHSWGLKEDELVPDLEFIDSLPGRKILTKGNHDLWWSTSSKLRALIAGRNLSTISFLATGAADTGDGVIICAARGWKTPGDKDYSEAADGKLFRRETIRLEKAISDAARLRSSAENKDCEIVLFMHFPPFGSHIAETEFTKIIESSGIKRCYYGHFHGVAPGCEPVFGNGSCRYSLISSDYLRFTPVSVSPQI